MVSAMFTLDWPTSDDQEIRARKRQACDHISNSHRAARGTAVTVVEQVAGHTIVDDPIVGGRGAGTDMEGASGEYARRCQPP